MLLTDMLPPERIRIPLESRSKDGLLHELVDALVSASGNGDAEGVLRAASRPLRRADVRARLVAAGRRVDFFQTLWEAEGA